MNPLPYRPSTAAWPTNAHDEIAAIESKAYHVARLGRAFAALHQNDLADELFEVANDLTGAAGALRDVVGNVVHDRYKDAQQSTSNMLGAVLALATRPARVTDTSKG